MDLQVKLRGQRIELGEIEHALRSQPGVVGAVVQLCPSVADEHALVAYVHPPSVLAEQGQVLFNTHTTEAVPLELVERLRGLRTVLPAYMMPSVVIGVEHWPRTSSDKIDRTALRSPSLLKQAADATNAATKLVNPSTQALVRCSMRFASISVQALACHWVQIWIRH
jgi:acyl-coenzyme A synthetase/AMP-(fatty) acid ligase